MSVPFEHSYIAMTEEVMSSFYQDNERCNRGLNLKATELRLGLPGSESPERSMEGARVTKNLSVAGAKRGFFDALDKKHQLTAGMKEAAPNSPKPALEKKPVAPANGHGFAPSSKAQIVGWPPIRSFRKNTMATGPPKNSDDAESKSGCVYVKVSMDGAPYLRKVDLKIYGSYSELSSALEKMFSCFTIGRCGSDEIPVGGGLNENCLKDLLHSSENVLTYEDKDGDWMLVGDVPWDMFTDSCKRLRIMKSSEAIGLAPRAMEKCKNRKQ